MSLVYVTPEGVEALQNGPVIAPSFKLGSQFGYVPGAPDTDVRGLTVLTGVPSSPHGITPTIWKYTITLGAHLNIQFGEIALFLHTGELFALTCLPALAKIEANPLDDDGVIGTIDIFILSNGTGFVDLNNNAYIAEAASINSLPRPIDTSVKFYVVPDPANPDLPLFVYRRSALWSYEGYDLMLRAPATSSTLTSVTFEGIPDIKANSILEFADGVFLGVTRVVGAVTQSATHTTIYFDAPLTAAPPQGMPFIVFAPPEEGTIIGSISASGSVPFVGNQSMGGNKLTNVGAPTNAGDVTNKAYVDGNFLALDGSNSPSNDVDWDGNRLTGLSSPVDSDDAATKAYVDNAASGALLDVQDDVNFNANKATNVGNPTAAGDAVNKGYADTNYINKDGSLPFTGNQSLGGHRLTDVAPPVDPTDAANKAYVESLIQGLRLLKPVRVVSASNVVLGVPGASMDSVSLSAGDRVLLMNQSSATENGVYVWNGAAVPLVRASDMDVGTITSGSYFWVLEGTVYHDTLWVLINDGTITVGTTPLQFQNFGALLGAGLVRSDGTVPFTGNQSMGGNRLTNLGDAVAAGDAIPKSQFDALVFLRDGSNVATGPFSLGGYKVTGVGNPTAATDAANKSYVDTHALLVDGSNKATNNLDLNGHKVINLPVPTLPTDAANKAYVDSSKADRVQTILSASGAVLLDLESYDSFDLTLAGNVVININPVRNKRFTVLLRRVDGFQGSSITLPPTVRKAQDVDYTTALATRRAGALDVLCFQVSSDNVLTLVDVAFDFVTSKPYFVMEQRKRLYEWQLVEEGTITFTLPVGDKVWVFAPSGPAPHAANVKLEVSQDGFAYNTLAEYTIDPEDTLEPAAFQSIDAASYFRFVVEDMVGTIVVRVTV